MRDDVGMRDRDRATAWAISLHLAILHPVVDKVPIAFSSIVFLLGILWDTVPMLPTTWINQFRVRLRRLRCSLIGCLVFSVL